MCWAKTPAALGFQYLEWSTFPQRFKTRDNKGNVGAYPDHTYYGYDIMSECKRVKIMACYDPGQSESLIFWLEMLRFCINDVKVLRKACQIYREIFLFALHLPL